MHFFVVGHILMFACLLSHSSHSNCPALIPGTFNDVWVEVPVSESHPCLLLSLSAGGSYSINPTFKLTHLVVVGEPAFRGFYSKQSKMPIIDPIPHLHSNRRNQNKLAETMDCFRIWNQGLSDHKGLVKCFQAAILRPNQEQYVIWMHGLWAFWAHQVHSAFLNLNSYIGLKAFFAG